jgi:DNA-directed RNA polymerase specialized sigma24 family protein
MKTLEQAKRRAFDLHWLATLLTGCRETAENVTVAAAGEPNAFFSTWMQVWARRTFIAKALAIVREDLARSARRTALRRAEMSELPPRSWVLDREITKRDLERALLPIDVFPRAAVLLLALERMPLQDAAVLLNSEPDMVRTAMAAGLRDLTINLARMQGWKSVASKSTSEAQHVSTTKLPS